MQRKALTSAKDRFAILSTAIIYRKFKEVCDLMDEDTLGILETDSQKNNAMHLAAFRCTEENAETIILLIGYLNQIDSLKLLCETNSAGQNPLHIAAKFNTLLAVGKIIEALKENAHIAARACANDGELPIFSLMWLQTLICAPQIIEPLLDATYHNPFQLSLTDKIDADKVVKNYSNHSYILKYTIRFACELMNSVRDSFNQSSTHPDANNHTPEMQDDIKQSIDIGRFLKQDERIEYVKKNKTGNCYEFVEYAFHLLKTIKPSRVRAEYAYIDAIEKNREHTHTFIIFNRPINSDINDFATLRDTVVCDLWSGSVFLASEIPSKLFCHFSLPFHTSSRAFKNIVEIFNPQFHKISIGTGVFFTEVNNFRPDLVLQIPDKPAYPPPPAPMM